MAKRFRRKRPRVAWMPTFGGAPLIDAAAGPWPGIEVELPLPPSGATSPDVVFDAFPLTFDEGESATTTQSDPLKVTLRDIVQGNEWRLRRIVGKCFLVATAAVQGSTIATAIDCAFGFMVVKTDDNGAPETDFADVNPLSQDSMEDPWIWRRRWLLHPNAVTPVGDEVTDNSPEYWQLPRNNTLYGSVADGPHIDAKTARVIHRSERLFGILAARRWQGGGDFAATPVQNQTLRMLLDYRIVGSLRSSQYGNRGNASR